MGIVTDGESTPVCQRANTRNSSWIDPVHAEAGGQLGDHGSITTSDGSLFEVYDVQSPVPGLFVHRGEARQGQITQGDAVSRRWMCTAVRRFREPIPRLT